MKREAPAICLSAEDYFRQEVETAIDERGLDTFPLARTYLVHLLSHYMDTRNLFDEKAEDGKSQRPTLAELYLKASNESQAVKFDMLKKLGDTSLYVSGFFAESLSNKLIDVDYYVDMGGAAYLTLAKGTTEDTQKQVFKEFSNKFIHFVDVLTWISKKSAIQTEKNLLQIYDNYIKNGSELAKEVLVKKGIVTTPVKNTKN